MGFLDFFKRLKQKAQGQLEGQKVKTIKFEELEEVIKQKQEKNKQKQQELMSEIRLHLSTLITNLNEKIPILKKVDLTLKKADERAKFIVKQNLDKYIFQLEKIVDNLDQINKNSLNLSLTEYIFKVQFTFSDFEKKTHMNFEKATFLIGKELEIIRDIIVNFFRGFKKITDNPLNKTFILNSKILKEVNKKFDEINRIKITQTTLDNNIRNIDNKIQEKKEKEKEKEKQVKSIKQSDEYLEDLKKQKKIEEQKDMIQQEIQNLKQMIDFKFLTNIYHSLEKQMNIIKEHQSNFQIAFKKNNQELLNLIADTNVDDSYMDKQKIIDKINQINKNKGQIKQDEQNSEFNQLKEVIALEREIKSGNQEIENLNHEKDKEQKKFEKQQLIRQELINGLKQELIKIGLELG